MSRRDALLMFLLSAVWGVSFLFIRVAGTAFPPAWVALGRIALGALFLWAVLLSGKRALPPAGRWAALLAAAVFNNALPFTLFAWGERTVPSNVAAVLNATTPLWTLLIGLGLAQQSHAARVSARTVGGVALGFLGVTLAVSAGRPGGPLSLPGVGLIALASLSYAVGIVAARRTLGGLDPLGLATAQLSVAALLLLPVALASPRPGPVSPAPLLALLALGVLGSGLAYLIFYSLLDRVPATHLSAVTYLLPVWGLAWGALAGEPVGPLSLAGVGTVLAGLTLLNWAGPAPKPGRG